MSYLLLLLLLSLPPLLPAQRIQLMDTERTFIDLTYINISIQHTRVSITVVLSSIGYMACSLSYPFSPLSLFQVMLQLLFKQSASREG